MRCLRLISRGLMAWAQLLHLVHLVHLLHLVHLVHLVHLAHLKRRLSGRLWLNLEPSLPCRGVRGSTRLSRTKRAIRSRGELLVHRLPSTPTARTAHLVSRTTSTRGLRLISRGLTEAECNSM